MSEARILAVWEDDPTESPLTVDLRLDGETSAGRWSIFGAVDLDGRACAPFVLRPDGRIDFGAAYPDRCWRTNLRERPIRVGEQFTVHWNDQDSALYRIEKVATLGSKGA